MAVDINDRTFEVQPDIERVSGKEVVVRVRVRNREIINQYYIKEAVIMAASQFLRDPGIKRLLSVSPIGVDGKPYQRTSRADPSPTEYEGTFQVMSL